MPVSSFQLCLSLLLLSARALSQSAEDIASSYGLTASTTLHLPTATAAVPSPSSWLKSEANIDGSIDRPQFMAFVDDPLAADNEAPSTVLQVEYPAGSFSNGTGGTQWYALFDESQQWQTMLLSYDLAFEAGYDWVKGGKLPGLRGGLPPGCGDGGQEVDGYDCWSARLMWRTDGEGEIYAYFLTTPELCESPNICDSSYGTSIDRGAFSFVPAAWTTLSLLISLNDPDSSNGFAQLYVNDTLVIQQFGMQYRLASNVTIGGLFFSTFFGGSDDTWSTPDTQYTYFRNMRMWAADVPSNM